MTNPQAIVVAAVVLAGALIVSNLQAAPSGGSEGGAGGSFRAIGEDHNGAMLVMNTRTGVVSFCEFDGDKSTCHRVGRAHSE